MSFALSEFLVESILRYGLKDLREGNELEYALEDIYGTLLTPLLSTKYGQQQVDKLRTYIKNAQISIVHALPVHADTKLPQISIHIMSDIEDEGDAFLGDAVEEEEISLEPETIVGIFTADSYDKNTGLIFVNNSIDLTNVRWNRWYIDGDGTEHRIDTPVSNESGNKYFSIEKGLQSINLTDGKIVSAIDREVYISNTIPARETLMFGVHSENALLTKFLYHLTKYVFYKYKEKFQENSFKLMKLEGSDFTQAMQLLPDHVYSRFITMSFLVYNKFRQRKGFVLDSISGQVQVPKDEFDRQEDEDQTVQTED